MYKDGCYSISYVDVIDPGPNCVVKVTLTFLMRPWFPEAAR
jgi:hypothetical protein